ncbi:NAD-dependent epimerase/dehydratase family protein [Limisphaera sp. VF-2]|uniref:NAD-dependent epimerase/dehydratase family protein n=1 Tax=Limisphaera sp. VF-2 TaxID=3400418 RepID=UPI003C16AD46
MRVLVTGVAGTIGRALVRQCLAHGDSVRGLDRRPVELEGGETRQADILEFPRLREAARGAAAVVHLAAEHRDDVRPVRLYHEVNVEGTRNVLRAAREVGCRRVIFTSTVAVYPLDVPCPAEDHPPAPFNAYGRSKAEAEALVRAWAEEDPTRCAVIVRPSVVFGEGNRGNVYNLLRQIHEGRFVMVGSGRNRKSMAYVGNVAAFLHWCLRLPPGLHVFNYADKPDLTTAELVALARRVMGRDGDWRARIRLPYAVALPLGWMADAVAAVTGRSLPVSSIRIRKFCAETTVNTERLERSGFVRPYGLIEALERTIRYEFGGGRE